MNKAFIFFFFLSHGLVSSKVTSFITIDSGTLEFIEKVNYNLYKKNEFVFKNTTSKDGISSLPVSVDFDSISFEKKNFETIGFKKEELNKVVYMKRSIFEMDEIVITNQRKGISILGERSRFLKRRSRALSKDAKYGLLFNLTNSKGSNISKVGFYVDKVMHRTTYKIRFYAVEEIGNFMEFQKLNFTEELFESPTMILEKGAKNKIDIDLKPYEVFINAQKVLVSIELLNYYDEAQNIIVPEFKDQTKLKFQLSERLDYYAKTVDLYTKELSDELININLMINYDFATQFFEKPHKSILVAPAILLYLNNH
ncbi:hypothetical protein LX97_00275 [Nonlabens dokdonensis]|jgi:hypothetical protein|uniref:Uncharacterized protein n=2 Tax=Nonlabens dokdonensis TaxID=328515 RepID=L7W5W1_NONDD|nr:hypothetical protein [Nonlabens dokdonensis]AGC75582.1 hypothetical protein DDD_0455 [Nonlabens dokdonensis DSW-6]PZX43275.1 hypothetical protein LX97_00275 [Nonlabens dokdonensis]